MFYQQSPGRTALARWLEELLPHLRPENREARLLDVITTAEILDLAYVQGAPLDSAVAAHALYPRYIEESERAAAPSTMTVTFPITVEDERGIRINITLRCGRCSEVKIGQGGIQRVTNPRNPVPPSLTQPRIEGMQYMLAEPGGGRIRSLAGPLRLFEAKLSGVIDQPQGTLQQPTLSPGGPLLYGYVDRHGQLHAPADSSGNLIGREASADALRELATYLWGEGRPAQVVIEASWVRQAPTRLLLTVSVRNVTQEPENADAKDAVLTALLLPHVKIALDGGSSAFPALQYADAKRTFVSLTTEDERRAEASRRLYSVRQSGCIATAAPGDPAVVTLATFGVFDTPREEPIAGPQIEEIVRSPRDFLGHVDNPSRALASWVQKHWQTIRAVLVSAAEAFSLTRLHRFQWEGILANLDFAAAEQYRRVTVVRAPTGAGKTIVFFVNAAVAALCGAERSTSVLMFPTRLLNEDMFRRLIVFTARIRANLPSPGVTGGILMGTSDPLYRLLLEPEEGEPMHYYGGCPTCGSSPLLASRAADRIVPRCSSCGHIVDYMYNPKEVAAYLPDLVIGTPDKLLYEATASRYDHYGIALFGARVLRCDSCGRVCPEACIRLKPAWEHCARFYSQPGSCSGKFSGPATSKLIRYMGFDEVHSLYGETATYLSMFLAGLETSQAILAGRREAPIRYETATATISNEIELIEALTRRRGLPGEIALVPAGAMHEYFLVLTDSARHRVLMTLPTRVSSRDAFVRSTLNAFLHLRNEDPELVERLQRHSGRIGEWRFLLGYLFKKQEGSDMRRALRDMYRNAFGAELSVEFLSGEAPKDQISRIVQKALAGDIDVLLANLVISLGVDIHPLNHMIMLGVPRSFTEYVQTAGRTGRGASPGHVHIILQPFYPRDAYLYRHFHAILSDVAGYYDVLPVRSTNLFCAGEIFGNVAKSLVTALCNNPPGVEPQWTHARGVRTVLGRLEGRIQGAIARILCDDPALMEDVRAMVEARLRQLRYELDTRDGFLSDVLYGSSVPWLITSLRGRAGSTVRVTCIDQPLMERLRAPLGDAEDQGDEETPTDED